MAERTAIEWCDSTFNPWWGCTKISPACDHCYAAALDKRTGGDHWGNVPRRRTSEHSWNEPRRWQRKAAEFFAKHGRRRRVFCASMADVFDNQVPEEWRMDLWDLIRDCPDLDWLLLTKRPQNISKMLPIYTLWNEIKCHVWLGTTIEDQTRAEQNIPHLLQHDAAVRFVSIEPMLGPIDLTTLPYGEILGNAPTYTDALSARLWMPKDSWSGRGHTQGERTYVDLCRGVSWVIAGGESGPHARPSHPDWFRSLRDQCAAAGVPFLFKQWGEWGMPTDTLGTLDWPYHPDYDRTHWFDSRTCARPIEAGWSNKYVGGGGAWPPPPFDMFKTPEYLDQVARCPQASCREASRCMGNEARAAVTRVGKKRAGRLLDGVEYNGFPRSSV